VLTAHRRDEIPKALAFAREKSLPLIPIGSGSNMLAPDKGVDAVFLRVALSDITPKIEDDRVTLSAEAGVSWDALVDRAVENNWWGLENLSTIPGTLGAAVVQNIGAYGAAVSESVE
jgi:UDP-N-acetylmuramate dehydrogenase